MDQFGEVGLRVAETVSPVFEPLHACSLRPDESVVDRGMPVVACSGVEEPRKSVLMHCNLFVPDCDRKWFCCHGFLIFFRPGLP